MADKPKQASEYKSEQVGFVRSTCLYVATKLGDLMDEVVVVGGLLGGDEGSALIAAADAWIAGHERRTPPPLDTLPRSTPSPARAWCRRLA